MSTISDAVVLVDENERVTFMNQEAESLTGFSSDDASDKPLWEVCRFIEQNSRESLLELIADGVSDDGIFAFPIATVLVSPDGTERLVRGSIYLSGNSETEQRVLESVVFRDVSSRWQIDTVSQRVQKSEALRVLAEGVASNLDDLLTILLARLSVIRRSQNDRSTVLRTIREAEEVIDRISVLVSSLSAGQFRGDSEKGITLVENVLRTSVSSLAAVFPDIELKLAYPDRTGYAGVPSDLVEQIVMNLLMNAAEAIEGDGSISLTACRVELEEDMKPILAGKYVMISVGDKGCGIPDNDLTRVFDPFFSTKGKSRGLGLSATYSIVKSYHGYLVLSSELGVGSTLSVYLPVADRITTETASDILPSVAVAGCTVNESDLLVRILESIGCIAESIPEEDENRKPLTSGNLQNRFNLLIIDCGFLMSEKEFSLDSIPSDVSVIVLLNTDEDVPEILSSGTALFRRPLRIDNTAVAIAECVWSRDMKEQAVSGDNI